MRGDARPHYAAGTVSQAFRDPAAFPFVRDLEAAFPQLRAELDRLDRRAFYDAPDSLTSVDGRYDERGWHYYSLFGSGDERADAARRRHCPATTAACLAVPGLANAGFSRFLPGTHLYPHRGELSGVLRCHLGLVVPDGDVAIRFGDEVRTWREGRCLVFDDGFEHEAWNHAATERVVLLVTFRPGSSAGG